MTAAIEVKNLNLILKKETILDDISVAYEKGKIHGVMGRNGSGKSMLFKCICGFVIPSSGEITVLGQKVGREVDFPKCVGVAIENPNFIPYYSGYQNIKMLASLSGGISEDEISELFELVKLDKRLKKHVKKYSMGMKQRLALIQAMMGKPDLLVLDEPMNGLDKNGVDDMRKLFLDYRDKGKTILMASHNPDDIRLMCDQTYEIEKGVLQHL